MEFLIWLLTGGIAGWLAGLIVKGYGFGIPGNILVGILGSLIAGWLLPRLGLHLGTGFIGEILDALIGAVLLLLGLSFFSRPTV